MRGSGVAWLGGRERNACVARRALHTSLLLFLSLTNEQGGGYGRPRQGLAGRGEEGVGRAGRDCQGAERGTARQQQASGRGGRHRRQGAGGGGGEEGHGCVACSWPDAECRRVWRGAGGRGRARVCRDTLAAFSSARPLFFRFASRVRNAEPRAHPPAHTRTPSTPPLVSLSPGSHLARALSEREEARETHPPARALRSLHNPLLTPATSGQEPPRSDSQPLYSGAPGCGLLATEGRGRREGTGDPPFARRRALCACAFAPDSLAPPR